MGGSGSQPALAEPQLLLGLFWGREAAQAAAALPGASCSPWGLIRGVPTVVRKLGVHQGLSTHHRSGVPGASGGRTGSGC